jgi:hypothetical protein
MMLLLVSRPSRPSALPLPSTVGDSLPSQCSQSNSLTGSDIYVNAPKSTTTTEPGPADAKSPRPVFVTDKIKNKFGKKDKENKDKTGDENAKGDKKPDMRPGNAGADAGSSTRI